MADPADTALQNAVDALARDVFPRIEAVRSHPEQVAPGPLPEISGLWIAIIQTILQSRVFEGAQAAARVDPVIGPVIAKQQGYVGSAIGGGGVLQAETVPLQLVQAACLELLVRGQAFTADSLAETATKNVDHLKSGLVGDQITGWAVTSFSALQLSPGTPLSTPWGDVVHADRLTAAIWPDARATCTAVLATPVPTKLVPMGSSPHWSSDSYYLRAYQIAQLVSYGVALGSSRDDPAGAVPTKIGGLLPLGMPGWGGEMRIVGFTTRSTPLTPAEANEAARWMGHLDVAPIDRVAVALRRLVRALAERYDAADQLIDAVIAWENLVEHRQKPTASVLWGMRALAGPAGWSKTRISRVYRTRSDVVHGEQPDHDRIRADAPDAIRIGLDALRRLLERHSQTLPMTSEARAVALGYRLPTGSLLQKGLDSVVDLARRVRHALGI